MNKELIRRNYDFDIRAQKMKKRKYNNWKTNSI